MTQYVLSTMTNSVAYCFYSDVPNGQVPRIKHRVTIQGGANIPSMKSGFGEVTKTDEGQPMWTPSGVVTPISDADYDMLMNHRVFKQHMENGHIKVIAKDITGNHKEVVKQVGTMQAKDDFAQLTSASLKQRVKVSMPGQAENHRL